MNRNRGDGMKLVGQEGSAKARSPKLHLFLLATCLALAGSVVPAAAADPVIGSYEYSPVGPPKATGKMVIEVTIVNRLTLSKFALDR